MAEHSPASDDQSQTSQEGRQGASETPPIPEQLPIMPLPDMVVFPGMLTPLTVGEPNYIKLIDDALAGDRLMAAVAIKSEKGEVKSPDDLYGVGCAGAIVKMLRFPDNTTRILFQAFRRIALKEPVQMEPYPVFKVEPRDDVVENDEELQGLVNHVTNQFQRMIDLSPQLPDEMKIAVMNLGDPARLADMVASNIKLDTRVRQALLEEVDVKTRLKHVASELRQQLRVLAITSELDSQVKEKMGKSQREYFLREQLKAIKEELGETDDNEAEIEELRKQLDQAGLPEEARKEADRELDRLRRMHPSSAEYSVARTYLDWMISLPWSKSTRDRLNIQKAEKILNEDHYGLDKLKERILEYLAVRKLKKDMKGPILCFAGPPGTGKTSMGRSIARAMGRKFVRVSLGGVRDEAEIRGHRRTYVGALPGRIIQGLRKAGANNPVFMLDEVDKLGSDFRGDPSSALLEVLDPEQNNSFSDHYLDAPFDLSNVMFITTANVLDTIPPPLRDRMEILELPGYTTEEKIQIAEQYLIPKQVKEHGLKKKQIRFEPDAIRAIIRDYTREAGLRNLEREIANCCRKIARRVAEGDKGPHVVHAADLADMLGAAKYFEDMAERTSIPGVAIGLAWTQTGGEILFIECTRMPGSGKLITTGSLGDVMKESAQAALSYVRSRARELGIAANAFSKSDIHLHVPAGAIPKDGPSAGVAITVCMTSLFTATPVKPYLAMTGEISLRGRVLPVGGIKEKVLAAQRAGVKTVILPKQNEKDLVDAPESARRELTFKFAETIDDALKVALPKPRKKRSSRA